MSLERSKIPSKFVTYVKGARGEIKSGVKRAINQSKNLSGSTSLPVNTIERMNRKRNEGGVNTRDIKYVIALALLKRKINEAEIKNHGLNAKRI